jgi:hypothetical protein
MPEHFPLFLTDQEIVELTGRKLRRLQIEQLRRRLLPFHVNALGRPVVTRAAVTGAHSAKKDAAQKGWAPRVVSE